ncbi:MAG: YgjP-like metallopeptidase domain-containing protein [Candidatus Aenigmatarchaeota archaeon]
MERTYLGSYKIHDKELKIFLILNSVKSKHLVLKKGLLFINLNKDKYKGSENIIKKFIFRFLNELDLKRIKKDYLERDIIFGKPVNKNFSEKQKMKMLVNVANSFVSEFYKRYFDGIIDKKIELKIKKYRNYLRLAMKKGNKIFLNYICYSFPKRLIRYLIFHEMLHTLSKNHDMFFETIERTIFPNVEELKKEIIKFSILASLNDKII